MKDFVDGMNWATENWKRENAGPLWKMDDDHGLSTLGVALNNYWVTLGLSFAALWSVRLDILNWGVTLYNMFDDTDGTVDHEELLGSNGVRFTDGLGLEHRVHFCNMIEPGHFAETVLIPLSDDHDNTITFNGYSSNFESLS